MIIVAYLLNYKVGNIFNKFLLIKILKTLLRPTN